MSRQLALDIFWNLPFTSGGDWHSVFVYSKLKMVGEEAIYSVVMFIFALIIILQGFKCVCRFGFLRIWHLFYPEIFLFFQLSCPVRNVMYKPTCCKFFLLYSSWARLDIFRTFHLGVWQEKFWKMSIGTDSDICVLSYSPFLNTIQENVRSSV